MNGDFFVYNLPADQIWKRGGGGTLATSKTRNKNSYVTVEGESGLRNNAGSYTYERVQLLLAQQ